MNEIPPFFDLEKYRHNRLFTEGSYPWDALLHLKDYLQNTPLGKIESPIPPGVVLVNKELISIGKNSIIEPGSYIAGPVMIGDDCQVRHGAYIRGHVVTGNQVIIGHATEVKNSILLDGASLSHFNYVGDSIIGNDVNLGAGLICANLRLDRENVILFWEENKIQTGLKKLGAVIGDGAQLGCNCVLNPGTLVGKKVFCAPLLKISGYILPNSIIKTSTQ